MKKAKKLKEAAAGTVEVVEADDWVEIYVDGAKVYSSHSLSYRAVCGLLVSLGFRVAHYWVGEDADGDLIVPERFSTFNDAGGDNVTRLAPRPLDTGELEEAGTLDSSPWEEEEE